MAGINRKKLKDYVSVFYQPNFKTFYVNSVDGKTFIKPTGIFVSLGITTSMKVLETIRDVISDSIEFDATIAEISSIKKGSQYLNTLIKVGNEVSQYDTGSDNCEHTDNVLNKVQAISKLERMKATLDADQSLENLKILAPKITKLQEIINNLEDSWDLFSIHETESGFSVYHHIVNYICKNDSEGGDVVDYRIGIYVTEKNNTKN